LKIDTLFSIGGSVGGIAWEILPLEPKLVQKILFHRFNGKTDC
jgi:hypothetical protein